MFMRLCNIVIRYAQLTSIEWRQLFFFFILLFKILFLVGKQSMNKISIFKKIITPHYTFTD